MHSNHEFCFDEPTFLSKTNIALRTYSLDKKIKKPNQWIQESVMKNEDNSEETTYTSTPVQFESLPSKVL